MNALGHHVSFEAECALARAHNFAGVDLNLDYLGALGSIQSAVDWFGTTGLRPGGFWLRTSWRETDSEDTFEQSLSVLEQDAKLAAALNCKRCVTSVAPSSKTLDFYQHFDLVVPRLIRSAELLAAEGIMLGFQFSGTATMRTGEDKDFVHTLDGARTFAAAIGMHTLNTGVLLDSFDWHASGGSCNEIEHLDHHEVVGTHLSDAVIGRTTAEQLTDERQLVGATGVIDIKGFLSSLRSTGYLGPLTVAPRDAHVRSMSP
jgi:sugar phosphate isomerase/epimerase